MSSRPGALLRGSSAIVGSAALLLACTLDFDRYASVTGASSPADGGGDEQPGQDAMAADATADASGDGSRTDGAPSSCTPAASCLQQASSCGGTCGQQYQQCSDGGCTGTPCMQDCRSTEQSCLGRCATACIACELTAGCPASSACLAASHT